MAENQKGKNRKNGPGTKTRRRFIKDAGIFISGAAIAPGIGHTPLNAKEGKEDCDKRPWLQRRK